MNLTDLRDELAARADDVTPSSHLTAGVHGRVRAVRRRRAAVAASATCATLVVAAVAVASSVTGGAPAPVPAGPARTATVGSDGLPFRVVPDAPGDVVKDGLRYRATVGDDRLAVGAIGDPGQGQFTLAWDVKTTRVSFAAECFLPGLSDVEAARYMVTVAIAGADGFLGSQCSGGTPRQRDLPAAGASPGGPGEGWSQLTVGRPAQVRVRLVDVRTQKPAAVEGARLTGAVYERGAQRRVTDEAGRPVASLPEVVEHAGLRYRLAETATGPARSLASIHIATPGGTPFLVTAGTADPAGGSDAATVYVTGLDEASGGSSGGLQTAAQRAREAGRVGLRSEGATPTGTALLALYLPDASTVNPPPTR